MNARRFRPSGWLWQFIGFAALATLLSGCIAIPVPDHYDQVTFGDTIADEKIRSLVSIGDELTAVKAKIGEPLINFGPGRVFVYRWVVHKGSLVWIVGGGGGAAFGVEPLINSWLYFVAFDAEGRALGTGSARYKPFDTIAEQVRAWLASAGLSEHVIGPRPGKTPKGKSLLFVHRPGTSPCPFPSFDANIFKPSVAIDGVIIGDLAKGEYLASEIESGTHLITINPIPPYEYAGQEASYFVQNIVKNSTIATLTIESNPNQATFIEAYLCTGTGKTVMHAVVRDLTEGEKSVSAANPSW